MVKYPNKERGEAIVAWLNTRPLISKSALCTLVEYPVEKFMKAFDGGLPIPAKFLDAFETELKKYGYLPPA